MARNYLALLVSAMSGFGLRLPPERRKLGDLNGHQRLGCLHRSPGTVGCAKAVQPHDTRSTAMPVSVLITTEFSHYSV